PTEEKSLSVGPPPALQRNAVEYETQTFLYPGDWRRLSRRRRAGARASLVSGRVRFGSAGHGTRCDHRGQAGKPALVVLPRREGPERQGREMELRGQHADLAYSERRVARHHQGRRRGDYQGLSREGCF